MRVSKMSFDLFWESYPTKKGKGAARTAYEKAMKGNDKDELHKDIMLAIEAQKRYRTEAKSTGEFIPQWKHPSTWLNQECWSDEIPSHAELKNSQPPEICTKDGCSDFTIGPKFSLCAYHQHENQPPNPNGVTIHDMRENALKREQGETQEGYIQRCREHCRRWL